MEFARPVPKNFMEKYSRKEAMTEANSAKVRILYKD